MNRHETLSVLACQIDIPGTPTAVLRDQHLRATANKVSRELALQHSDLVVLPELSSVDYSRESFDKLSELAEDSHGASFQVWRTIAQDYKTTVLYSYPRLYQGQFYISIAAVGPNGDLLGVYDKMHLAQFGASMEKDYFSQGDTLFTFTIKGYVLAPIICYDIRVPEMSRTLALEHNVDMIVHAGAYFRDESFYSWHSFVVTRAIENQIYLLSLNRAGEHYGKSILCTPWVDETLQPTILSEHEEAFRRFIISRQEIQQTRRHYSFRSDRLEQYVVRRAIDDDSP